MRVVSLSLLVLASAGLRTPDEPAAAPVNPVTRVVELIRGLKGKVEADGKAEQRVYDKFACWCEETSGTKAAAIEKAKTTIASLDKSIAELNGKLGSSGAELDQLKKDIVSKKDSIKKAEEMRTKENGEYKKTKAALEQAIKNLDKAITVLGGLPQQSRAGFADAEDGMNSGTALTAVETDVMTVAAGLRSAMHLYAKTNDVSNDEDFASVKTFVANPASLLSTSSSSPHKGTYNTQSTAIQGILDEMHEQFERDLEDANNEEGSRLSAFNELHDTNTNDLTMLKSSLVKQNSDDGGSTKDLADDEEEREETEKQLKTDEAFLETTLDSCKAKADEWAERSRLRTEELLGIGQAIDILTADDAVSTFAKSDTTFVQLAVVTKNDSRTRAYNILKEAASKTNSLHLALIAARVSATGHFDDVMGDIDEMIQALRDEESADVAHKDMCETERSKAASSADSLKYDMDQLDAKVGRLGAKKNNLNAAILATVGEMELLQTAMDTALDNRKSENTAFKTALKDDTDAVALLKKTVAALSKFATNNGLALVAKKHHQKHHKKGEPEYTESPDVAPETFGEGGYGGRSSESTGIVAIISMIQEDMEKEMVQGKETEAKSLAAYQTLYDESAANMQALKDKETSLESDVAGTDKEISDTNAVKSDTGSSKTAAADSFTAIEDECTWIENNFKTRRGQRQSEMDGLHAAKSALAGATPGEVEAAKAGFMARTTATVPGKKHSVQDELRDLDQVESHFETNFLQR